MSSNIKKINQDEKRIHISVNGIDTRDVEIKLDDGTNLGLIQSFKIECKVGELNKLVLESILEKAEIDILQKHTELKIILPKRYKLGYWINHIFYNIFK